MFIWLNTPELVKYIFQNTLGKDPGIGVENLRFSGLIAGETSKAYDEIVTMNLVRCFLDMFWKSFTFCLPLSVS